MVHVLAGEKLWRLPMEETYREILDSPIADMKNTGIGTRFGGAITASIFLKEFVETDKVCACALALFLQISARSGAGWT